MWNTMNNIYQSNKNYLRQKYLRMDVWSHLDLSFKDYTVISESEIYEDIYVSQQSTFIIPSKYHEFGLDNEKKTKVKIKMDQGDIVRVKNEYGKTMFMGIIFSIEDFEPIESFKIICKPIFSILDVKLFYNGFGFESKSVLAKEIESLINTNLKGIENNEFNKKYIVVEIDDDVKNIEGIIPFEKPKEIILWYFFRTIYANFELYLEFSMKFTTENNKNFLHIKITKNKQEKPIKLKNNFADLQNLFIDDLYKQTLNILDIYKEDETEPGKFEIEETFILLKKPNENVDQKNELVIKLNEVKKEGNRIYPEVIKTLLSKDILKEKK